MKLQSAKKKKSMIKKVLFFSALLIVYCSLFIACSSAPKKAPEIFTSLLLAANQLKLANQTADQGRYEDALLILDEALRLALSTDDSALRIKTSMSRGNILFSMGRHSEAFTEWENAAAEGDDSDQPVLAAQARIYTIRGKLVLLANESGDGWKEGDTAAAEYKVQLNQELVLVKSDALSTASGYVTLGMAEKQMGHWVEAESVVKQALEIHDKNRYLEDAAYDWFLIASIRSLAGNYDSSLQALEKALSFDRRAENGFGLASSWQAAGDVYQKAGRTEESRKAYRRAVDIFRAINLKDRAENLEAKL